MGEAQQTTGAGIGAVQLAQLALFRGVDPGLVGPLVRDCELRELSTGDVLIRAGQPNRFLYLLLEGRLALELARRSELEQRVAAKRRELIRRHRDALVHAAKPARAWARSRSSTAIRPRRTWSRSTPAA